MDQEAYGVRDREADIGTSGRTTDCQPRSISVLEAFVNVAVGYVVALLTQMSLFPLFGLDVSTNSNLLISCVFSVVSIVRSFALRRLFEAFRLRTR